MLPFARVRARYYSYDRRLVADGTHFVRHSRLDEYEIYGSSLSFCIASYHPMMVPGAPDVLSATLGAPGMELAPRGPKRRY